MCRWQVDGISVKILVFVSPFFGASAKPVIPRSLNPLLHPRLSYETTKRSQVWEVPVSPVTRLSRTPALTLPGGTCQPPGCPLPGDEAEVPSGHWQEGQHDTGDDVTLRTRAAGVQLSDCSCLGRIWGENGDLLVPAA